MLARMIIIFATSCIILLKSYSTGIISIFPDSIFEKSSISFIKVSNVCPAFWMLKAYSRMFSSLLSRNIMASMPRTALIGVLISWDMLAKNRPFVSLDISASCFSFSMVKILLMVFTKETININIRPNAITEPLN